MNYGLTKTGYTFYQTVYGAFKYYPVTKLAPVVTFSGGGIYANKSAYPFSAYANTLHVNHKKKKVVVLGTGWAGTNFLKGLKDPSYEVQVVSPRNYFLFTPLLPSVTCGTLEARSIVESVRKIAEKKGLVFQFTEAECFKIDTVNKTIQCKSSRDGNLNDAEHFDIDYDYLVIGVGARINTFNTPGVVENCHFLKEVADAQKIRMTVIDCFEKANLPTVSEAERKRILHFVIVGGGPTGVEFAAELHDFVDKDMGKLYPNIKDLVKITLLEAGDRILNTYEKRITDFTEETFKRDGIDLKTGSMVVKVTDKEIYTKERATKEDGSLPYGMVVWSTGNETRPFVSNFMAEIGQGNRRVLATDEWFRVEGCDNVYAFGDCATVNQRKIMEDISAIFSKADKNKSGKLSVSDVKDVIKDICERYPQVEVYLKNKKLKNFADLLKNNQGNSGKEVIDIEVFKAALSEVDKNIKNLPATAQVAEQQGMYLANCFNHMEKCEKNPEGPLKFKEDGRHRFHPFRYKHGGQFIRLGGVTASESPLLPGDGVSIGQIPQWLWYWTYTSKLVSWRAKSMVVFDWSRRFLSGRDSSKI